MGADNTVEKKIVSGINSANMESLIIGLYDDLEKLVTKLNTIEQQVDGLASVCKGTFFTQFFSDFSEFEKNFSTISSNVQSYINDITTAKNNFKNMYYEAQKVSKL